MRARWLRAPRARAKAAGVVAEALGIPFPRPFAPAVTAREVELEGVRGDLYRPGRPAPGIVLVPGAAPRGKDDPRAVRLARALSRARRVVFVPALELAERRFAPDDLERIKAATAALAASEHATGRISLLGFSYGGSFSLIAAADARLAGVVEQVAVFGAYFDLVGVIQAVTTGISLVDGQTIRWVGHPRAEEVLHEVAVRLAPAEARPELRSALSGASSSSELSAEAGALYELLKNDDPRRTFPLAQQLPDRTRELLRLFSPSSVASEVQAPVIAMHSKDDPVVPYGELLRLHAGLPAARCVSVSLFSHVDFHSGSPRAWLGAVGDFWTTWRFASWLLAAQERRGGVFGARASSG